jgi:hypothetical protein
MLLQIICVCQNNVLDTNFQALACPLTSNLVKGVRRTTGIHILGKSNTSPIHPRVVHCILMRCITNFLREFKVIAKTVGSD